jgi:hypothetical protein
VWDALKVKINVHDRRFQFPSITSNFAQPLKRSGTTFHSHNQRPDELYAKEMSRCMGQLVVTPDTDWFSEPRPYLFYFFKVSVTYRCISVLPVM